MSPTAPGGPELPLPLRAFNALGRGAERLGWRTLRLDEGELLARACRMAKLEDFGRETFRPGLVRLVESLERDAKLHPFGRFFARRQILELLVHRLQLVEYRKHHPELELERIERPLFVLGLPRTGTTLLYGLLAQDPAHRVPLSWEVDDPCPPPERATYATDPRIARTEKRMEQLRQLAPGFQDIHPVGAMLPQECIVLTASEFMSIRFEMCFDVAGYQEWLLHEDMTPTYHWHRRFLQHLQSRCRGERWVLKSPGHLGAIDALLAVYPDAMILQTHRDPKRIVPSVASLEYCGRGIATSEQDAAQLGRQQLRTWSTLLDACLESRARCGDEASRFLDLHYHEIAADPLGSVRRVYRHFDLDLSETAEARMRARLAADPRAGHGPHAYSLARFDLDTATVDRVFKGYCERFGIRPEAE